MGQILYTLYGHEVRIIFYSKGPASAVNFSYEGDFFFSGGVDSVVMVWKSNVNMISYGNSVFIFRTRRFIQRRRKNEIEQKIY